MSAPTLRLHQTGAPSGSWLARRWRVDAATFLTFSTWAIGVLFMAGALGRARLKPYWHDEIFTVALSRLSVREVWSALLDGVDLVPPGIHYLTQASHALFGTGPIGTRMPAAIGVLVAAIAAGVFVRRRLGAVAGLSAMLILLCSDAYLYAYEARPYGVVLGLAAVAFLCWQSAVAATPRALWLAGLFASLALALACHYYAVLLLVPLAAGELARLYRTRTPDWPLWAAMAASLAALFVCWPLMRTASEFSPGYFSPARLQTVVVTFESTLTKMAVPLLLVLVIAGGLAPLRRGHAGPGPDFARHADHEWAAVVLLVLLPVVSYVLAVGWTRALVPRYCLPWTIGFSILLPMTIARTSRHPRMVFAVLATVLFLWFGARQVSSARWLAREAPDLSSLYPSLTTRAGGDLPIVIGHPHVYLAAVFYAGPDLRSRLVWLTPARRQSLATDTSIRAFRALGRRMPLRIESFESFTASRSRFFVYGPPTAAVLTSLRDAGAHLAFQGRDEDVPRYAGSRPGPNLLFEVTFD